LVAVLLALALAGPAAAHKDHQKKVEQTSTAQATVPDPAGEVVSHPMSPAVHEAVKDDIARMEAEAAMPVHERLLDWLGRVHPFAVHFPLALFPVAWLALILGRRRGDAGDLLRAIIIVAGCSAAVAGVLGWLNAGWAMTDRDPLLHWHRWLGTAIAIAGAALALAAWRSEAVVKGRFMVASLGGLTIALLGQGWLGGALIHGIDHLNW
jgi:uncharacterized membrane protein YidH (DUF202 family)